MIVAAGIVRKPPTWLLFLILSLLLGATDGWSPNSLRPSRQPFYMTTETAKNKDLDDENFHTLPRLYVGPNVKLADGIRFTLAPDQAHYVTKVMRIGKKKSKNSARVFDGKNGEWLAQIQVEQDDDSTPKLRKRRDDATISAQCTRQLRPQNSNDNCSVSEPWLFFAPIKKHRVKLMLEKCTEMGVGRFVPILTERADPSSVRDVTRDLDKLATQTIEASEQCERLTVPPLAETCVDHDRGDELWDLPKLLKEWSTLDTFRDKHLLICRERTADCSVPVLKLLQEVIDDDTAISVALVVGPEGGWSTAEEELCDEYTTSSSNIHCVSLGSLVLRAETAAITAVSACMLYQELYNDDDSIANNS